MRNQIWFPSTFDWLPPDIWDAQAKFQTFQSLFLILQKKTVSVLLGCLEAQKPFQGQPWIQVQMHMKLHDLKILKTWLKHTKLAEYNVIHYAIHA